MTTSFSHFHGSTTSTLAIACRRTTSTSIRTSRFDRRERWVHDIAREDIDIARAWRVVFKPRAQSHLSGRLSRISLHVGSDHRIYAEASFIQHYGHGTTCRYP